MEDGAEPQQWLTEGATPAVAVEQSEGADGAAPAADTSADLDPVSAESADSDAATDAATDAAPDVAVDTGAASQPSVFERSAAYDDELDPVTYGENGSYVYEDSVPHQFGHEAYRGESQVDGGYNFHMSPPAEESAAVPPYPAELPANPVTSAPPQAPAGKPRGAKAVGARLRGQQGAPARRASLVIERLEPWSVMKFSFLMSLVAWVVLFVAVAVLYYALSAAGVFSALGKTLASVSSSQGSSGIVLSKWTAPSRVLGYTMLIGAVDIIIITALSTIGSMVYNLVAHLGGGIEVTLKEAD